LERIGFDYDELESLSPPRFEPAGFFVLEYRKGSVMPNHLTPEELSKELGIDRQEIIRVCIEEGVPIYQGRIDKTLFQAQLEAIRSGASAKSA
jgi:hypothetical protein